MSLACPCRSGAAEERLGHNTRTVRPCQLPGVGIDIGEGDVLRHGELRFGLTSERLDHERCPDGQGRLRSAETERLILVEAHPDHGQQIVCEACKPRVPKIVGGACLAGRVRREAQSTRARTGSFVDHAPHHVGDLECRIGPSDGPRLAEGHFDCAGATACHSHDRAQRSHGTLVRKHRIRLSDLVRRAFEHAQRDSGIRVRRCPYANLFPKGGNLVVADAFGDLDRRNVPRHGERASERDRSIVLALIIRRRPFLIAVVERRRFVIDDRRRREVGQRPLGGLLEGREIHEWFEHGTRLASCAHCAVVLRLVVRATPDHCQDVTGTGIDGDQRRLRRSCFPASA